MASGRDSIDGVAAPEAAADAWVVLTPTGSHRSSANLTLAWRILTAMTGRELRSRYRQSIGRSLWMLVEPVSIVVIYGFVFTRIFNVTGEGIPYLSMAWAGIVVWQYFGYGVQAGSMALLQEADTLQKIWYPRVAIPLIPATAAAVDLAIGLALLAPVALWQGIRPTPHLVAIVVPLVVLALWTYALALLLSPVTVFVRDLNTMVPLALRIGFFVTPVMYSADAMPAGLSWLAVVNPVAVCITSIRDVALAGTWPDWPALALQGIAGAVALALAYRYFQRVEHRLADAL